MEKLHIEAIFLDSLPFQIQNATVTTGNTQHLHKGFLVEQNLQTVAACRLMLASRLNRILGIRKIWKNRGKIRELF